MSMIGMAKIAGVSALALSMAGSAYAQVGEIPGGNPGLYYGHRMMWDGGQWGGFGMFLGPVFMILILVGIIAGIIYLLRLFGGNVLPSGSSAGSDRPMAILKERFARGEIDSKEFEERRKLLGD